MNQLDMFRDGEKIHKYEVGLWYVNPNIDTPNRGLPEGIDPLDNVCVMLGQDRYEGETIPAKRWSWATGRRSDGALTYSSIRMFKIVSRGPDEPA